MDDEKRLRQFDKWGAPRPSHDPHGTPEEIRANLQPAVASSWHLEGNLLVAYTQHGIIKQTIPTNYICLGMDDKGLPILKKLDIS